MTTKKSFISKFLYAVSANMIGLLVSIITTLLIPRFLGVKVEEYGYLQLYLFYTSYVGFLHFGWVDGILLREAGKSYELIDKKIYSTEYKLFILFETCISIVISIATYFFVNDIDKAFVFYFVAANVLIMLMRAFLQYVLQATHRIKEYAITASVGRILYLCSCALVMLIGIRTYKIFVISDTACKILSLFITIYFCRDLVIAKGGRLFDSSIFREIRLNVSAGVKLVFANIASMLITGIIRQGIENNWDISTFGKVSLTLSISNFFITFISAVAIVLFPTLRTVDKEKLNPIYYNICDALSVVSFGILVFYYPLREILSLWLPQYRDGLTYMAILFPMCFYLSKVTLVIQTYYQVHRYEKDLMIVNIISLGIASISAYVSIYLFHSLTLAVLAILINQGIRCIIAELHLARKNNLNVITRIVVEGLMVLVFVIANWLASGWIGCIIYFGLYVVYIVFKRREILNLKDKLFKRKRLENENERV